MVDSGADLFNVDHMVDFDRACDVYLQAGVCFKGNLNPVTDFMGITAEKCRDRCLGLLHKTRGYQYMLSAGCEIPASVTDEVFEAFCRAPQAVLSGMV
jgi:uroporphyrinogen-III decarboxylase